MSDKQNASSRADLAFGAFVGDLPDRVVSLETEIAGLRAELARSDRLLAAFRNRDIVTHGSTGWRVYTRDGCTLCDTLEAAWRVLGIVEGEADATR